MRDAELAQVRQEPSRAREREVRPELQPVEGAKAHQPRRRTSSERDSTSTGSRAANERSSACGSAVESSSFQRAPKRRAGSWNVTGSWYALKSSRNDSSAIGSPREVVSC